MQIPSALLLIGILIRGLPGVVRDVRAKVAAAKDPGSPDGAKVDVQEVAGIVATIGMDIAALLVPAVASANGVEPGELAGIFSPVTTPPAGTGRSLPTP